MQILDRLSHGQASHPGRKHIIQLLDHFEHTGPNGTHPCLVLELLGPSVLSTAESYPSNRLPGNIAWEASRQIVQALAYIHANGVAHGGQSRLSSCHRSLARPMDANKSVPLDLHPGNIVLANTMTPHRCDTDVSRSVGTPTTSDVIATPGHPLTPQVPKYLVVSTSFPSLAQDPKNCHMKIVDFGEAFLPGQRRQVRCPLIFRAPEAVLTSEWDLQADIWSLGCTVSCRLQRFMDMC